MSNPLKLFISYSNDSPEHNKMVLGLAERFRTEQGIDCQIDQHLLPAYPPEGWMKWMRDRIKEADWVLMIFTPTYRDRFERNVKEGGYGVGFESLIISDMLYWEYSKTKKFIPVICDAGSIDDITCGLRGGNNYKVPNDFQSIADLIKGKRYNPLSPLAEISTPRPPVSGVVIPTKREPVSISSTPPSSKHDSYNPQWASKSGSDHYGQYADLTVGEVSQRFRLIQPDSFWMGSPESEAERESIDIKETRHQVTLSERFWLADTVCTQSFWKVVFGNNPAHFKGNDDNPVEQVNLNDIKEFIETLNSMDSTFSFSLPTEAQWEYACRAGTNTPFSFCENITPEVVNYDGNYPYADGVQGLFRERTVPVKSMPANPWGLHEMNGNVWEYCLDTYQKDLGNLACVDPLNVMGRYAVLRGGSWNSHAKHCRSSSRRFADSSERNVSFGLRLCLVVTA